MADEGNLKHEEKFVVFQLAGESYGVNILQVREIIRMQEITEIPQTLDYIKGVINLRGRITPVIDLRKRFGLPAAEYTSSTRIVVVQMMDQLIGIIVDAVTEVLPVPADAIEPPSRIITGVDSKYIKGIAKLLERRQSRSMEDRLIIVLDLDNVLNTKGKEALQSMAEDIAQGRVQAETA